MDISIILPHLNPSTTNNPLLEFLAPLVPTLIGAFGGGYGAYYLQMNREKKEKQKSQIAVTIEAY